MDNFSSQRSEPIGEVNFGIVQWYNKPRNKDTMLGSAISYIDGSEVRFDERVVANRDHKPALREGSAIVYGTAGDGRKASVVFDLSCVASDDQIDVYLEMLAKLAERLNDPDYTKAVRSAEGRNIDLKVRVSYLRVTLLKKAKLRELCNIGKVNMGKVLFYSYSHKYNSTFGYVKSCIDGKEMRVEPDDLCNCSGLKEGSFVIYEEGKGKNANHVFDLSRLGYDDEIKYWAMLVKLAECLNDPDYTRTLQFVKKYFNTAEERVNFVCEFLHIKFFKSIKANPFSRLPKDFLIHFPEYFDLAANEQRVYLYLNDQELFAKCLKSAENSEASGSMDMKEIAAALPEDFLINFPEYIDKATNEQRVYLYLNDQELFAKCLKSAENSEALGSLDIKEIAATLPEDFLVNCPDLFAYATPKQCAYLYKKDLELFAKSLKSAENFGALDIERIAAALPEDFLINFPEYLGEASEEQLHYYFEKDEQGFIAEMEKPSEPQKKTAVPKMQEDFTVKYPQFADYASAEQLRYMSRKEERERIYEYAQQRGIEYLVHFTRLKHLKSILENGLITRANLKRFGINIIPNDPNRLDHVLNSISLSVSFPNHELFYKWKGNANLQWCVLLLKTEILRDIDCAFNLGNAAKHSNSTTPLAERETLEKFQEFFGNYGERSKLIGKHPEIYATDPQSEILCLGNIPVSYISGCCYVVDDFSVFNKYKPIMEKQGIKIYNDRWYFGRGPYENYLTQRERNAPEYFDAIANINYNNQ